MVHAELALLKMPERRFDQQLLPTQYGKIRYKEIVIARTIRLRYGQTGKQQLQIVSSKPDLHLLVRKRNVMIGQQRDRRLTARKHRILVVTDQQPGQRLTVRKHRTRAATGQRRHDLQRLIVRIGPLRALKPLTVQVRLIAVQDRIAGTTGRLLLDQAHQVLVQIGIEVGMIVHLQGPTEVLLDQVHLTAAPLGQALQTGVLDQVRLIAARRGLVPGLLLHPAKTGHEARLVTALVLPEIGIDAVMTKS